MRIKPGIYQHYKGNKYRVIGMARHSETLEDMVMYQGLYNSPEFGDNPVFVRPATTFLDDVATNNQTVKRFTMLEV
jgi:hypothetical protein